LVGGGTREGIFDADGRESDDVVGAGGDSDTGLFEGGEHFAADLVLESADVVRAAKKADGELDPVVGEAVEDARANVGRFNEELSFRRSSSGCARLAISVV
jgi:hypothetical protein